MTKSLKIYLIIGILLIVLGFILMFALKKQETPTYVVTFDSKGGTIVVEQIIEEGSLATKPVDPEKDGYIFVSWMLDGITFDFNNAIDKNIVLTANWMEKEPDKTFITVKFNSNGGTTVSNSIIEKGSKLTNPTNPTKSGYTFVEWQLNGAKFNFDKEITEEIELVAKWEKNKTTSDNKKNDSSQKENQPKPTPQPTEKKYTVTFDSNGGSYVASQTIVEGKKLTRPATPTKNGYTFVSWMLDGKTYDFNLPITKNITLTATWKEKETYIVSFDSNGGSAVSSQNVKEGSKVSKPSNPTKEGYNFSAWQLNGKNFDFNSNVTGNITLVAKWNQKNYTVKVASIDQYSPDRILTVYEDGNKINVSSIKYGNATLCSGSNLVVNVYEIEGISSLTVILSGGTSVTASVN